MSSKLTNNQRARLARNSGVRARAGATVFYGIELREPRPVGPGHSGTRPLAVMLASDLGSNGADHRGLQHRQSNDGHRGHAKRATIMPRNKEKRSDRLVRERRQEQRLKEMAARRRVPSPSVKRIEQLTLRASAKPSRYWRVRAVAG
jgi:hypothetical protein